MHSHPRHNLGVNKYENGNWKLFLYQEFQKSLAVETMLREYKVLKFYYRYYMLWVSENENCASNGTNSDSHLNKRSGYARQSCYCYRVKLIIIGNMFYGWLSTT